MTLLRKFELKTFYFEVTSDYNYNSKHKHNSKLGEIRWIEYDQITSKKLNQTFSYHLSWADRPIADEPGSSFNFTLGNSPWPAWAAIILR